MVRLLKVVGLRLAVAFVGAYALYGDIDDAAWASTEVTIGPPPGSPGAGGEPVVKRRPRVTPGGPCKAIN
jgi:hypothetical protein